MRKVLEVRRVFANAASTESGETAVPLNTKPVTPLDKPVALPTRRDLSVRALQAIYPGAACSGDLSHFAQLLEAIARGWA